jgi:hypothetical protein
VQVSLGSLDRPDLVRPDDHVWTKRQLPWLKMADDLPRFATNSDAVPSRAVADDDGGADHHGTPGGPRPLRVAGGCHCGNLELTFETGRGPAELTVRACGCSFCRRHGVRTVSDPQGRIEFVVHDPAQLNRYRFGLGTAEFLVCRICGVYVGAVMAAMGSAYAIANVNALETPEVFGTAAVPVSYDGESAAERQARRQARWTPAAVVARAGPGQAVAPGDTAP